MDDLENIFFRSDGPIPEFPPALGSTDRIRGTSDDVFAVAEKKIRKNAALPHIHFLAGGDDPILWSVKKAYAQLTDLGWPADYLEIPGYQHEWAFWDLAIRRAIEEILPIRKTLFRFFHGGKEKKIWQSIVRLSTKK